MSSLYVDESQGSSSQSIIVPDGAGMRVQRKTNPPVVDPTLVSLATNINVKMKSLDSMMDPKMNLSTPCRDDIDVWAKEFMVDVVHTGAKKLISNEATLDIYSTVMNGVRGYHNIIVEKIKFTDGQSSTTTKDCC